MAVSESTKKLQRSRVLRGQCPLCGKEAAPYRLCSGHRLQPRLNRALKRGEKFGVFSREGAARGTKWKFEKDSTSDEYLKWSTPVVLPDTDKRSHPRLRKIRVDVEATLLEVVKFIGRSCTIEEITSAWGKLRADRSQPLSVDLACIIRAADLRARRNAKRAAIAHTTTATLPSTGK